MIVGPTVMRGTVPTRRRDVYLQPLARFPAPGTSSSSSPSPPTPCPRPTRGEKTGRQTVRSTICVRRRRLRGVRVSSSNLCGTPTKPRAGGSAGVVVEHAGIEPATSAMPLLPVTWLPRSSPSHHCHSSPEVPPGRARLYDREEVVRSRDAMTRGVIGLCRLLHLRRFSA